VKKRGPDAREGSPEDSMPPSGPIAVSIARPVFRSIGSSLPKGKLPSLAQSFPRGRETEGRQRPGMAESEANSVTPSMRACGFRVRVCWSPASNSDGYGRRVFSVRRSAG
jgi:hypothetical protein